MKFFKTKPLYNAPRYEITPAMFEIANYLMKPLI